MKQFAGLLVAVVWLGAWQECPAQYYQFYYGYYGPSLHQGYVPYYTYYPPYSFAPSYSLVPYSYYYYPPQYYSGPIGSSWGSWSTPWGSMGYYHSGNTSYFYQQQYMPRRHGR